MGAMGSGPGRFPGLFAYRRVRFCGFIQFLMFLLRLSEVFWVWTQGERTQEESTPEERRQEERTQEERPQEERTQEERTPEERPIRT